MSNAIVITVPHRLGSEEAKRRISERIELLRRDYIDKLAYSEANWNGDTANFRVVAFGQTATAQLYVMVGQAIPPDWPKVAVWSAA